MTPLERQTIAVFKERFGIQSDAFDPIANKRDANEVARRLRFQVTYEWRSWRARRSQDEQPFLVMTGDGSRNQAIVEAARIALGIELDQPKRKLDIPKL